MIDNFMCSNLNFTEVIIQVTTLFETESENFFEATQTFIINVVPKPLRENRVLFSIYHSLKYPENGYVLRDSIFGDKFPYDWKGDHLFTNYVSLYKYLSTKGFIVEILNEPLTCFNATEFNALMLIDPELELSKEEIVKLRYDLVYSNLNLLLITEWNDDNLRQLHSIGDQRFSKLSMSNMISLNALLKPFSI